MRPLSQLQSPGVSALRGTRAGRVDAQARGAAPARALLSAHCDRAGGAARGVPALSSRVLSLVLRRRSRVGEEDLLQEKAPRRGRRLHRDPPQLDAPDVLSPSHSHPDSGRGLKPRRLPIAASPQPGISHPGEGPRLCCEQGPPELAQGQSC